MIPSAANSDYPKFVADQVLTSDNLNDLFGYLDEQGRLIRTNLLGIGIVCGLEIITANDGSSITITKGVGITSSGYLISLPAVEYTRRTTGFFNAAKNEYYDKLVNLDSKTNKYDLWELKQDHETERTTDLKKSFLTNPEGGKIVLLFVELLEENNKNCDPNSCGNKGAQVTMNFRPLLLSKSDAANLIATTDTDRVTASAFNALPDLLMPRWNVPNSLPIYAGDINEAYQNILSPRFISRVQRILSTSWQTFQLIVLQEFPSDPFAAFDLIERFAFLNDSKINLHKSLHIQYYYDFFSDLIAAYEEFCLIGNEIISECSPDEKLFPHHLLLGEAIPLPYDKPSDYRHYFVYSPLFQRKSLLKELKFLFRRMVLILNSFQLPPVTDSSSDDKNIIITPSQLSGDPISTKAIPYYYKPNLAPLALYQNWSFLKTKRNRAEQNLSYYASFYAKDDFVKNPLNYDLESFNFFRLEGIIGKSVKWVLDTIKKRISDHRLPIKVVALATGEPGKGSEDDNCCFLPDLQMQYRLFREELLSCLENNIKYWGSIQKKKSETGQLIFQIENMPLTYMGYYLPRIVPAKETVQEYQPMMLKTEENTFEKYVNKAPENIAQKDSEKLAKKEVFHQEKAFKLKKESIRNTIQQIGNNTMASIYLDYKTLEDIHMVALPRPKIDTPVENIQYYVLILIDEWEAMINLLATENVSEFDGQSFGGRVQTLYKTCGSLGDLLSEYKKTDYLVQKIRVTFENRREDIDAVANLMPKIAEDDASKIIFLLANIENFKTFISDLGKNEGNYLAQQATIKSYYDKLDKDRMMIPMDKNPDSGFVSSYAPLLEKLKSCRCNDAMDKVIYLLEKYHNQLDKLRDINNFSVYTKAHPGIQHKAGVPNGGTFIVVYKGPKDTSDNIAENTVIADFYLPYSCCSNCTPVEVTFQEAPTTPNRPPVARPGDNITIQLPDNIVELDGSTSSDPDGTIQSYLWELQSGHEATIENQNESKIKVLDLKEGIYVFKLTVTDNDGAINSATLTVKVLPVKNTPPVAVASAEPAIVTLTKNGSGVSQLIGSKSEDPNGEIKSFLWSLLSSPTDGVEIDAPKKSDTKVSFSKPGEYIFKLMVTGKRELTDTATVQVTVVKKENESPVAKATAKPEELTLTKEQKEAQSTLDGSRSHDPDGGTISSYNWLLSKGKTSVKISTPDKSKTTVRFTEPADYEFQLTVTDNDGAKAIDKVLVKVSQAEVPQKECGSLRAIYDEFQKLNENESKGFNSFKKKYSDFNRIVRLYAQMAKGDMFNVEVEKQIKFFTNQKTESQLPIWIAHLEKLTQDPGLRTFALSMLRIHTKLTYYIACIENKDIVKGKGNLEKPLNALEGIFKLVEKDSPDFTKQQKKVVADLQNISVKERINVKNNNEEKSKDSYVKFLDRFIKNIKRGG